MRRKPHGQGGSAPALAGAGFGFRRWRRAARIALAIPVAGAALIVWAAPARIPAALYAAECAACHGTDGRGNAMIDAPALAGLDAAYIERQLHGFRAGYRGADERDPEGLEMRPMALALSEADGAALAQWLAALPAFKQPAMATGDPERGRERYAPCAACHGAAGEGNPALAAPRLAGQAAWYSQRQLRRFIEGVRGAHPQDAWGQSMRAGVVATNPDDAPHIAAWLETLAADASAAN